MGANGIQEEYVFPVVENKESVLFLSVVALHWRHTRLDSISKNKD